MEWALNALETLIIVLLGGFFGARISHHFALKTASKNELTSKKNDLRDLFLELNESLQHLLDVHNKSVVIANRRPDGIPEIQFDKEQFIEHTVNARNIARRAVLLSTDQETTDFLSGILESITDPFEYRSSMEVLEMHDQFIDKFIEKMGDSQSVLEDTLNDFSEQYKRI